MQRLVGVVVADTLRPCQRRVGLELQGCVHIVRFNNGVHCDSALGTRQNNTRINQPVLDPIMPLDGA